MRRWDKYCEENTYLVLFFSFCFQESSFSTSVSLTPPGSSSLASGPNFILRRRPAVEEKRALCKAPSVASSWQPWTPVPQAGEKPLPAENAPEDSLFLPPLARATLPGCWRVRGSGTGRSPSTLRRSHLCSTWMMKTYGPLMCDMQRPGVPERWRCDSVSLLRWRTEANGTHSGGTHPAGFWFCYI